MPEIGARAGRFIVTLSRDLRHGAWMQGSVPVQKRPGVAQYWRVGVFTAVYDLSGLRGHSTRTLANGKVRAELTNVQSLQLRQTWSFSVGHCPTVPLHTTAMMTILAGAVCAASRYRKGCAGTCRFARKLGVCRGMRTEGQAELCRAQLARRARANLRVPDKYAPQTRMQATEPCVQD